MTDSRQFGRFVGVIISHAVSSWMCPVSFVTCSHHGSNTFQNKFSSFLLQSRLEAFARGCIGYMCFQHIRKAWFPDRNSCAFSACSPENIKSTHASIENCINALRVCFNCYEMRRHVYYWNGICLTVSHSLYSNDWTRSGQQRLLLCFCRRTRFKQQFRVSHRL